MTHCKDALTWGTDILKHSSASARLDAEILLCHVIQKDRVFLYTHPEYNVSSDLLSVYHTLLEKRRKGVPIAYLTGVREFWSLPLQTTQDTLIPRPETELLVEIILKQLDASTSARILDLGTGSGAIALAIASARPHWHIVACDRSEAALNVAMANAKQLLIQNVTWIHSDWFNHIPLPLEPSNGFHVIVSNPPYLAEDDAHLIDGDIQFEPRTALVSGVTGLEALDHIIQNSPSYLSSNGMLLLEHGYTQRQAVCDLLQKSGYSNIQFWQDYQGMDRVSGGIVMSPELLF